MSRVELNRRNIGGILTGKHGRIEDDLRARGRRILSAAGPGHEMQEHRGSTRSRVTVRTVKPVKPSGHAALRRAFGAGR